MFSIVIPLYNKAHTIKGTLHSVLNQTYSYFEVVIVDDGSSDKGVEIIRQFTNDTRIRIISQQNQGVSAARNRGISESKFDYIAFLDGDDEWKPEFLNEIRIGIEKFPEAGIFGTSSLHKNLNTKETIDATIEKYRNKIALVDCFRNPGLLPHTSAIVIKKIALYNIDTDYNVFPIGMKVCEDWACIHRAALTNSLVYIGRPLGVRHNNVEGQITGRTGPTDKELYEIWLDGVRYYNLVFNYWLETTPQNPNFLLMIKYNLRHNFKSFILSEKWDIISLIANRLDKGIISSLEFKLYKIQKASFISITYINARKVIYKIGNFIRAKKISP